MRTIKFRAWNPDTTFSKAEMAYEWGFGSAISEAFAVKCTTANDSDTVLELADWQKEIVFMQFTGLLDKNGKEIWEGDIVTSLGTTFIVKYDGDGFYAVNGDEYASLNSYTGLNYPYDIDDAEVIGNLYENPEILSNTK